MTQNFFSVTIFLVVFRETLEAAIIVSVLLGLVDQIVHGESFEEPSQTSTPPAIQYDEPPFQDPVLRAKVARRMKFQVRAVMTAAPVI